MIDKTIRLTEDYLELFDIRFIKGGNETAIQLLKEGGLMVVPSAPSLYLIKDNPYYHQCLKDAKFAIPDSGLMVLLLRLLYNIRLQKLSGLAFLRMYLNDCVKEKDKTLFLVEPTQDEHNANTAYLNETGVQYSPDNFYIAPLYKDSVIEDAALLKQLEKQKPDSIIINLGGGIQEKLGFYLQENLSYSPAIICTGAAIAFLTGRQVPIPVWADRLYLGWLFRCISHPSRYIPRYLASIKLVSLLVGCQVENESSSQENR